MPAAARPTTPPVTGLAAAGPQHARAATPSVGPQHPRPSTPPPVHGHGGFGGHGGHGGQAGTTPPSNRPSTPPSALAGYARPSTPPPIAAAQGGPAYQRPSTPIPSDVASGLSAGYGDAAQVDLGAFAQSQFSLSSLDGEDSPAASNQFDAPPAALPPEDDKPVVTMKAKPKAEAAPKPKAPAANKPMDLFAPPDAGDQDLSVDLATEEVAEIVARRGSTVPPVNAAPQPPPSSSSSLPSMRRASTPLPVAGGEPVYGTSMAAERFSRGNFVLGIVVALAIGFVPAHFVANMREKTAFAEFDRQVAAMDASADSQETYAALDAAREKLLEEKQSARTMIALTSMALWAVVAAAVAFAFFRMSASKPKPKQQDA